ncbi:MULTISPECIES: hypothetical protein [unclassified Crossiella]|uniref:hypothetical protein n=1 Tax=unclassified Crossiella TaxID=2620835 RepID=UPI001FFF5388|nr:MULTISPECIES: hypothetical protein [unclassified Crossiella]MCK2244972.1 hypothetical protein [Crossiella sp. S99.2]MCK2258697.1 hypothetical protein [Crossiella sp. S99.1]
MRAVLLAIVLSLLGVLTPACEPPVENAAVLPLSGPHSPEPSKDSHKPAKEGHKPAKESPKEEFPRKAAREAPAHLVARRPRLATELLATQRLAHGPRADAHRPPHRLRPAEHLHELTAPPALQVFRN